MLTAYKEEQAGLGRFPVMQPGHRVDVPESNIDSSDACHEGGQVPVSA